MLNCVEGFIFYSSVASSIVYFKLFKDPNVPVKALPKDFCPVIKSQVLFICSIMIQNGTLENFITKETSLNMMWIKH